MAAGCARVLINRDLAAALTNNWSTRNTAERGLYEVATRAVGRRKKVQLAPLWRSRKARRRWEELLVEGDADPFVHRFFSAPAAAEKGLLLALEPAAEVGAGPVEAAGPAAAEEPHVTA